ncbi:MAG: MFS transporter [Candidatus Hydrogenedentes bacterium]|nr:MFS transporter [Candidatus Hydrogenedentota bacterium]
MRLRGISRNVVALGGASFFTDVASEMLYPVIPLFLVNTLGASPALLGMIEGLAEAVSTGLRWVGGVWSDRTGRRKPFVFLGYSVSAISKPIMGLAAYAIGWPLFLVGRCSDRFGKSIRTAARDALIADSTAPEYRGLAFGFHRAVDTCGAIVGPVITLAILAVAPGLPLAWLFLLAFIPGIASSLVVVASVRDIPQVRPGGADARPFRLSGYPTGFWHLLAGLAVFSLGNSSDSFLILRSKEVGLSFTQIIAVYILFSLVYALAAAPCGRLSDRIGRRPLVICGLGTYAVVYAGFAYSRSPLAPWILFAVYGLYQALSEGVTKAMISDFVPPERRAGAIGLFAAVTGLGQLVASLLAGGLWEMRVANGRLMPSFLLGVVCALAAIPLIAYRPRPRPRQ